MKVINYKYGCLFNCSIHGKIIVSQKEWRDIKKYLLNPFTIISPHGKFDNYFWKGLLKDDFDRPIKIKEGNLYNIRVTATRKVFSKFNLPKYKKGNYMFLVKSERG